MEKRLCYAVILMKGMCKGFWHCFCTEAFCEESGWGSRMGLCRDSSGVCSLWGQRGGNEWMVML